MVGKAHTRQRIAGSPPPAGHRLLGLLLALVLLTPAGLGAIVNGRDAAPGAWPSFAAILFDGSWECGGALVEDSWVLSAAHCFVDARTGVVSPSSVEVVIGTTDLNDGEARTVTDIVVHPGYDVATTANDIALLRLSAPSSMPVQPFVRPGQESAFAPGTEATVIGGGATNPEGDEFPDRLQETEVPIRSDSACAGSYPNYDSTRMLCAGDPGPDPNNPGADTCGGDSGGPILTPNGGDFLQVGITSFGGLCGVEDPGVYTRLISYVDWVDGVTGDGEPVPDPSNPGPGEMGADSITRVSRQTGVTEPIGQAAVVSQMVFDRGGAEYAVLARADEFPDALGGSSLAFGLAPLLFASQAPSLPEATRTELLRAVQPGGDVYVLGGGAAVNRAIDDELVSLGFNPVRLEGPGREETAAAVADEVLATTLFEGVPQDTMIVATRGNWPDAVMAGQLGAFWGYPILLTPPTFLHQATRDALQRHRPDLVLVIGGTGVVSDDVVAEIEAVTGPDSAFRLGGRTRTETAAAVLDAHLFLLEEFFPNEPLPEFATVVNLRRGDAFAHVLSASVFAGFGDVLVATETDDGSVFTGDIAAAICGLDLPIIVAGDVDLISNSGVAQVQAALRGEGC